MAKPSSRMKAALRIERVRAAHRQVVDRAVNRQRSDVAAGKEQRLHHEGIRGEGQARAADFDDGLIVQRPSAGFAKAGRKDIPQQLGAELPAAAVAQQDLIALVTARGADSMRSCDSDFHERVQRR